MEERRNAVQRRAGALGLLAAAVAAATPALACELPPGKRLESAALTLSYRTVPAKIAVGEPFVLELAACPKGVAPLPGRVKLDAHMPEHKHGMNYRPSIAPAGAGRYRSEGWIFHMPGRWEFVFDFGPERLVDSVRIE
jgi:hypothetical protein